VDISRVDRNIGKYHKWNAACYAPPSDGDTSTDRTIDRHNARCVAMPRMKARETWVVRGGMDRQDYRLSDLN